MTEHRKISSRLQLSDAKLHSRPDKLTVEFDDPPGPSPARFIMPILHGQEEVVDELSRDLRPRVDKVGVGGVYSGAYTDETYAILLFALGGLAGGVLGAIGQDVWNGLKKACSKVFRGRGAKRNVLEVAIRFEEIDVVFHFENRNASSLPGALDDADAILVELHDALHRDSSPLAAARAIELRQIPGESAFECILHSYRKAEVILKELIKPPRRSKKTAREPKKRSKPNAAGPKKSPDKQ
ncbi:MAG: hypothetical protein FJ291_04600 [Planctomycetes bacterium]|nr:hypothetical protein [Planctomycetota bacterium]